MALKPNRSIVTSVATGTATVALLIASGCRPIKIDKSNTGSAAGCADATLDVGGTCIKDGFVYLLQDAVAGKVEQSGGKTLLAFGKQSLVKGDKLFATGKLSFAKTASGSNAALNYQLGSANVGASSTQFIGDSEAISVAHHTLTYQVNETSESPVTLVAGITSPSVSSSDGSLLIFRQTQLSQALDPRIQKDGAPPYFAAEMLDNDKLKASDLKVNSVSTTLIELEPKNLKPNDILFVRSGSAWDIAEGKGNACEGSSVSWSLAVDQKEITSDGPQLISASHPIGSSSLQSIYKSVSGATSVKIALSAKIDSGNKPERNGCVLKIADPTTLSVIVFRAIAHLPADIQGARYLHDMGSVQAPAGRFSSHQSGPPIETLLNFNWDHLRSDTLLTDTHVTLAAEDRLQQTKAYVQLSRAPDGLSSHVGKAILMSPDKPHTIAITDMALGQDLTTQTRFYLTGMAYSNDSKNVIVNEALIFFMHFRRIGDRL